MFIYFKYSVFFLVFFLLLLIYIGKKLSISKSAKPRSFIITSTALCQGTSEKFEEILFWKKIPQSWANPSSQFSLSTLTMMSLSRSPAPLVKKLFWPEWRKRKDLVPGCLASSWLQQDGFVAAAWFHSTSKICWSSNTSVQNAKLWLARVAEEDASRKWNNCQQTKEDSEVFV